jgi:hypothetical protein
LGSCPTWVAINDSVVTEILEQYFPENSDRGERGTS